MRSRTYVGVLVLLCAGCGSSGLVGPDNPMADATSTGDASNPFAEASDATEIGDGSEGTFGTGGSGGDVEPAPSADAAADAAPWDAGRIDADGTAAVDSGGPDAADGSTDATVSSLDATSGDAALSDAQAAEGACPAPSPDSGVQPYKAFANGTIEGPDVNASFCGVTLWVYRSPYTTPSDQYVLFVNSDDRSTAIAFQDPANADMGLVTGTVSIPSAAAGVYTNTARQACGGIAFSYYLPVPPGVDCSDGSAPNCPPGCGYECGLTCTCFAIFPQVGFQAQDPSDCVGDTQTPMGSWTTTITSITPYAIDGGPTGYYTPHGTFTTALVSADGGTTETLSLTF